MKQAKKVEIPTDRPLTFKEYEKLSKHAINSARWNIQNYSRNSWQVADKLRNKGYLKEDVTYIDSDGQICQSNIIDETLSKLVEEGTLDDDKLAKDYVESNSLSGKSLSSVRTKMMQRLYPRDLIDKTIEKFEEENEDSEQESFDYAAERLNRNSSFRRLEPIKRKQKFIRTLASKGFSLNLIYEWINSNPGEMESDEWAD